MRRFTSVIIGIILSLSLFTTSPVLAKEITFAVGEWAPFIGSELKNFGPLAEIVTLATEKAGYSAKLKFMPWSRAMGMVETGKMVATFPWSHTQERADKGCLYPKTPILVSSWVAFFLKEKYPEGITVKTLEDLKPYKMVGLSQYWYEKPAMEAGIDIHLVLKSESAWKLLQRGRKDIMVEERYVGNGEINKFFPNEAASFGHSDAFKVTEQFVLFSEKNPNGAEAKEKIDAALQALVNDGTYEKIMKQHGL